ncbi:hypothetical protein ACVMIH_007005 [Bradyrhizobium sp. USDA 4503]|uniref:hypothetical protein n=1 Tax=Bradyrhizobium brasilense TaxID=1419277 RepID=UPI001E5E1A4C|nr:hypothetical protein [Bradyrhizobium brasilense]MCC8944089.1 hypothetical protein [Bradyrhizobium brasilense]
MVKKRRKRTIQTMSLTARLDRLAQESRAKAAGLPPGAEREHLLKKAREARRAIEIEDLLKRRGVELPV